MERRIFLASILTIGAMATCRGAVIEPKPQSIKVFNYQGALPIKDDRTGEVIRNDDEIGAPLEVHNQTDNGEACWNLIVQESAVTFALHNKALDQLQADLKDLPVEKGLQTALDKLTSNLKRSMNEALDALKNESPEDYFDSLFETSESIIAMSSLIRDPQLDEKVFLALVKAVSRLGRNNSALVQEFIDQCSFTERSRPRVFDLDLASISS